MHRFCFVLRECGVFCPRACLTQALCWRQAERERDMQEFKVALSHYAFLCAARYLPSVWCYRTTPLLCAVWYSPGVWCYRRTTLLCAARAAIFETDTAFNGSKATIYGGIRVAFSEPKLPCMKLMQTDVCGSDAALFPVLYGGGAAIYRGDTAIYRGDPTFYGGGADDSGGSCA
eukprot:3938197-Rhodomonas_salina.8